MFPGPIRIVVYFSWGEPITYANALIPVRRVKTAENIPSAHHLFVARQTGSLVLSVNRLDVELRFQGCAVLL